MGGLDLDSIGAGGNIGKHLLSVKLKTVPKI